jgi:hypothetical protein
MMMKHFYSAPTVEQIPMDVQQAVMVSSPDGSLPSITPGDDIFNASTSGRAGYGSGSNYAAGSSDLEDMINDILTY